MNNGYVKIHRKLLNNPIVMKDCEHFAVWIYLLLNATHQDRNVLFKGKKIIIGPGQLITGRKSISSELQISESKVQRILNFFETEHQIEQQTSNKNRVITLTNWHKYQDNEHQIEQQLNNNRTTTEQQLNTNNNDKNVNNVRNIYSTSTTNKEEINGRNGNERNGDENLFEYVERLFRRTLNPAEYEVINNWEDSELTRYAVKDAVLNNACSVKYIERILERYRQNNFQSVGDVLEDKKLKEEKELTEEEKEILNFDWLG
jgi:putative phage regulatory protein|nr:MAG TPA: replisome organizer [Caudoviricetes sp.]